MASTRCVHCQNQVGVTVFPSAGRWDDPLLAWVENPSLRGWISQQGPQLGQIMAVIDQVTTLREAEKPPEKWRIARCEECKRPLFVVMDEGQRDILRTYPATSPEAPEHIPPGVAEDFVEANLCLSVGAFKASVALSRRTLQAAALNLKCKKTSKLIDQLDELGKRGSLNSSLLEAAHQVRHFGNYGSHPDGDGLGSITPDEATAVRNLTWQVLEDLYVNPARVKAVRQSLASKRRRPKKANGVDPAGP